VFLVRQEAVRPPSPFSLQVRDKQTTGDSKKKNGRRKSEGEEEHSSPHIQILCGHALLLHINFYIHRVKERLLARSLLPLEEPLKNNTAPLATLPFPLRKTDSLFDSF